MMTLVMLNDREGVMNQEEADQDVADEVSAGVDSVLRKVWSDSKSYR